MRSHHITEEERHEHTDHRRTDDHHQRLTTQISHKAQYGESYHRQTRSQTIDVVEHRDGIGDIEHREDRQGNAKEGRYLIDAQQTVEIVKPQTGQGNQQSRQNLDEQLGLDRHTQEVVHGPQQVHRGQTCHRKHILDEGLVGLTGDDIGLTSHQQSNDGDT